MAIEKSILLGVNEISTILATSESGEYVDDNLINQQPSELWKATTAVTQTISGALTGLKRISGFALGGHNMETETVRLELAVDSGYNNIIYDQTWTVKQADYGWGEGVWGNIYSTWGGYALDEGGIETQFIKTFSAVSVQYYRVTLGSMVVTPQAGVLFLGQALQSGVQRAPSIPVVDPSDIVMTRGQSMRSDNQPTYREIGITYVALTADEAHQFRRVCRSTGKRKLMVFSMQPGIGGADEKETSMVCRMIDWNGPERIPNSVTARYTATATFREAL